MERGMKHPMKNDNLYGKTRAIKEFMHRAAFAAMIFLLGISLCLPAAFPVMAQALEEDITFEAYGGKLVTWSADGSTVMSEYPDGTLILVEEGEAYTGKDEVALYLYGFECLPDNFITKNEAKALGWSSSKGNLDDIAPGKSIGGDRFGNYEGLLPKEKNRQYYECDINYQGGYRQADRIIYSNDGLVYYTGDHYKSFEQLY